MHYRETERGKCDFQIISSLYFYSISRVQKRLPAYWARFSYAKVDKVSSYRIFLSNSRGMITVKLNRLEEFRSPKPN